MSDFDEIMNKLADADAEIQRLRFQLAAARKDVRFAGVIFFLLGACAASYTICSVWG